MVARIRGSERERDNVPLRHYPRSMQGDTTLDRINQVTDWFWKRL